MRLLGRAVTSSLVLLLCVGPAASTIILWTLLKPTIHFDGGVGFGYVTGVVFVFQLIVLVGAVKLLWWIWTTSFHFYTLAIPLKALGALLACMSPTFLSMIAWRFLSPDIPYDFFLDSNDGFFGWIGAFQFLTAVGMAAGLCDTESFD